MQCLTYNLCLGNGIPPNENTSVGTAGASR